MGNRLMMMKVRLRMRVGERGFSEEVFEVTLSQAHKISLAPIC